MAILVGCVFVSNLIAVGQESQVRYLVDAADPPMSAIIGYSWIGEDSAIAADSRGGLFLIESDRRAKQVGAIGSGPCEVREVASFSINGDTLFVLDNRAGRITGFSISDGSCVTEVVHPELSRFSSMSRVDGGYVLVKSNYTSATAPGEFILYRLEDSEVLEPLALTVSDLQADLLMAPIRFGRRTTQIRTRGDVLYFLLPFSHRLWQYHTKTDEVSYFSLANDSGDISRYSESTDPAQFSAARKNMESELDVFLQDDKVVVLSNFENQWKLGAYSYSGQLIAKEAARHVDFVEEGQLYALVPVDSGDRIYEIRPVKAPEPR